MKKLIFPLFLIFFVSAVIHFPLSIAAKFIPQIPQLTLANPSGTVWKGTFFTVQWQGVNLGDLNWDFNPLRIFTGKLDIDFKLSGESALSADGRAGVGFSGAYARKVKLEFASSFVESFISTPMPINTTGRIYFDIDEYTVSAPLCETLIGKGRWKDATLGIPIGEVDLGSVNVNLSCQNKGLQVNVNSSSDALDTELLLNLTEKFNYKIAGNLKANDGLPSAIKNQLQWLGQPDQQGRYSLNFSG